MGDNVKAAPIMKIRRHHSGLAESMATMKEIPATLAAVKEYMQQTNGGLPYTQAELDSVQVKPYTARPDTRIGWDNTYIVTYLPRNTENRMIFGMCDQLVSL